MDDNSIEYSEEMRAVVFWGYDLGERVRVIVPSFALLEGLQRELSRLEQVYFDEDGDAVRLRLSSDPCR